MLIMSSIQTLSQDITGAVGFSVLILKEQNLQLQIVPDETL